MQAVTFYISLPLLYLISAMPFWILYRISDLLFVLIFYVFGYRRKIVRMNLTNSFPEKNAQEITQIERRFYRYFCDLVVETLKTLTISNRTLKKRLRFEGLEVFQKYAEKDQSLIIVMGHWGNWELAGARFAQEPLHKLIVIYHPLHNKYFDKLVYHMRTRLGNGLYAMKNTLRGMIRDRNELTATAFIADQTPSKVDTLWMEFMHQDTAVFTGTGKIAHKMKYPVIYAGIRRTSRGRYTIEVEELIADPSASDPETIIKRFMTRLEQDIRQIPEIWLWTHRRWKHKRSKD